MARACVLLTSEDAYPYQQRGVSRWCDVLTKELAEIDFVLLAVTTHPYLATQYRLSNNIREMITVPVGGTQDPAEYGDHESFVDYLRRCWSMAAEDVEKDYLPAYERLLQEVTSPSQPPRKLGLTLLQLHQHLRHYDYYRTQMHPAVWETFVAITVRAWRSVYALEPSPSIAELVEAWRLLHRLLLPLAIEVPKVDLTHSSAAAFCGLPCIMAKLRRQTPFLLTEHGVHLRDQYLASTSASPFVRWFFLRLVNTMVDVNYAFADQISPVCQYNMRWETWRGVEPGRLRLIYNGVDPDQFRPAARTDHGRPTVVNLGGIGPLKGQLDLIEAAALVRRNMPDVQFRLCGSPADNTYFVHCQELVRALGLQDTVVFPGKVIDPASVLQQADVVALASLSEAFPYTIIEAMLTEAAIVATDVGGVSEALGDSGLLVHPRDPVAMAEAIDSLLRCPEDRRHLGQRARQRALFGFTTLRFADAYRWSYQHLMAPDGAVPDRTEPTFPIEPDTEPALAIAES